MTCHEAGADALLTESGHADFRTVTTEPLLKWWVTTQPYTAVKIMWDDATLSDGRGKRPTLDLEVRSYDYLRQTLTEFLGDRVTMRACATGCLATTRASLAQQTFATGRITL